MPVSPSSLLSLLTPGCSPPDTPSSRQTSFIKALAQYTKRSVISIPLTKISTNQELMDIMMDQKIKCNDSDSFSLPYSK